MKRTCGHMDIVINVELEKFRYSLIGDGYLKEEVVNMSQAELIHILKERIGNHIEAEFAKTVRYDWLEDEEE